MLARSIFFYPSTILGCAPDKASRAVVELLGSGQIFKAARTGSYRRRGQNRFQRRAPASKKDQCCRSHGVSTAASERSSLYRSLSTPRLKLNWRRVCALAHLHAFVPWPERRAVGGRGRWAWPSSSAAAKSARLLPGAHRYGSGGGRFRVTTAGNLPRTCGCRLQLHGHRSRVRLALLRQIFLAAFFLEPRLGYVPAQRFVNLSEGCGVSEHSLHQEFGHEHNLVATCVQFDAARPTQRRANDVKSCVAADAGQQYGEYRWAGLHSQTPSGGQTLQRSCSLGDDFLGRLDAKDAFQLWQIAYVEDKDAEGLVVAAQPA